MQLKALTVWDKDQASSKRNRDYLEQGQGLLSWAIRRRSNWWGESRVVRDSPH